MIIEIVDSIRGSKMGTNFYVRLNYCEHCGRYETLHIGKRSCGWKFDFAYDNFKSINVKTEDIKEQNVVLKNRKK